MSKSQSIILLACLAIMIGVGVDHVQAQARPKATAADPWEATQGLGMSERLSGLGHECRPYVVGTVVQQSEEA